MEFATEDDAGVPASRRRGAGGVRPISSSKNVTPRRGSPIITSRKFPVEIILTHYQEACFRIARETIKYMARNELQA